MLYLHVSNKTENLLRHLAAVIDTDRKTSVFEKEVFLIQGRGMERMLSQGLADLFGCWCNFEYLPPISFLHLIGERLGMRITPDFFDREVLSWRLEKLLRNLDHPVYSPLQNYLSGGNCSLKRVQLARKLANIFDQYQMMRPDMLESWSRNKIVENHPAEKWQQHLWQRLHEDPQVSHHRGILVKKVVDRLKSDEELSGMLPSRVSIFGLHIMPPLFLEFIQAFSLHSEVHLYLLSPCGGYWGNIDTRRRKVARNISRLKRGEMVEPVDDNLHPLLETLGKQGSEFQEMLLANVDFKLELNSFEDPRNQSAPNLLHHIQSDLLAGEIRAGHDRWQKPPNDGSLKVISAHSRIREVMILKDTILDWLHNDHDLELKNIIVMAPDIQEYAQLIAPFFEELPHSIADRNIGRHNTTIAAFLEFLEMGTGRYGWSELFDLFSRPIIYPTFEVSAADLDQLHHWIIDAGVRWGLSADQRMEHDLVGFSENSWNDGLARLLMGYAMGSEELVGDILPYIDIEGSRAQSLGGLCHFVQLLDRARHDFGKERTLAQWSELLLGYVERLFGVDDDPGLVELRTMINDLQLKFSHFHEEKVELMVIHHWLEKSAEDIRSSTGFLSGQLTFCSMLPMRSIPFQCVCLLGIDNGLFPAQDRHATFDIMGEYHRLGDRSKRADDRYQFLEAILAARKHLYISYVGQSDRSNNSIPPSVVVTELMELLEFEYDIHDLVEKHPLQPFDRNYFSGDTKLFSYNQNYCQVAARLALQEKRIEPWWTGELDDKPKQPVQLDSLFSFYTNPQKWFVRNRLGIRMDKDKGQIPEQELFVLGGLDAYLVDQEIIYETLTGREPDEILRRLQAAGRWPLANPGKIDFQRKWSELKDFIRRIEQKELGKRLGDLSVDLQVGSYHLVGRLMNVYEDGIMLYRYSKCKGKDLLQGYITSLLLSQSLEVPQKVHVLTQDKQFFFQSDTEVEPSLERLIELYIEGWKKPSQLFVEPGWKYFLQQQSSRARVAPIKKARQFFIEQLEEKEAGQAVYEPEWALLYGGVGPQQVIGEQFIQAYDEILGRIFSLSRDG